MMNVRVNANTIVTSNVADKIDNHYASGYVNMTQFSQLSPGEKEKLIQSIVAVLADQCHQLAQNPPAISSEKVKALATEIEATTKMVAFTDLTKKEDSKNTVASALKKTKEVLGPAAEIVLSITKLAQLFGSLG